MMVSKRRRTFLLALAAGVAAGSRAYGVSERVVSDPLTGLALHGYDPVTYFTGSEPRQGAVELEARWEGAVWRFANPGNRAAFLSHPRRYAPQFGGHDPMSAARGLVSRGNPLIYVVDDDRLYLFSGPEGRAAWERDKAFVIPQAERNWPRLAEELVR